MVDQVRDIGIIGLLLEYEIVLRDRVRCLLGRILRNLWSIFLRLTSRQHRFGTLVSLAAPSSLAGRGAAALIAEQRPRNNGELDSARRTDDRLAREIVEACFARLANALRAAGGFVGLDGGVDGDLAMLRSWSKAPPGWPRRRVPGP